MSGGRSTYEPGDRVRLGPDRGIVRLRRRANGSTVMSDGRPFLQVAILSGPRKGQWDWPDHWEQDTEAEQDTRPVEISTGYQLLNHCSRCQRYRLCSSVTGQGQQRWLWLCFKCQRELKETKTP